MSPACFEPEPPDVSIIIPTYNRGDVIHYTLESVRRAKGGFHVETIVVDDGSLRPIDEDIKRLGYDREVHVIRQSNQGLLFARLTGIAAATGRHVLFLDSDDLISPQKLTAQLTAMDQGGFDVSYTDTARTTLQGAYNDLVFEPDAPTPSTSDGADFFINIQPAPHSPIFRASFLRDIVHAALFPPSPLYNAVAEIWFYHNAAPRPARVVHVPGAHTIIGSHGDVRLTSQWERLAVGSLGVMEAFARSVPDTAEFARARTLVGEKAFRSWRRLPRDFHEEYDRRLLQLWLNLAPSGGCTPLGGTAFRLAGALLGPVAAGRLFRRWQGSDYHSSRTMKDAEFFQLLARLPAA